MEEFKYLISGELYKQDAWWDPKERVYYKEDILINDNSKIYDINPSLHLRSLSTANLTVDWKAGILDLSFSLLFLNQYPVSLGDHSNQWMVQNFVSTLLKNRWDTVLLSGQDIKQLSAKFLWINFDPIGRTIGRSKPKPETKSP